MDRVEKAIAIDVRHVPETVARRVRAWFERSAPGTRLGVVDGSRSILLPHPDRRDVVLKIKGAGLEGGKIEFGRHPTTGPMSAIFDFDGRMMEDVASGHDNALLGGASFQQAATEYNVSRLLASLGYDVVPCLGYGRVETPEGVSWFSVFEWSKSWSSIVISPHFSAEQYLAANLEISQRHVEIAVRHHLLGYFGYTHRGDGTFLIKDLHPFRRSDPINHSQLSWTLQLLHALRIRCSACRFFARAGGVTTADDELSAIPLRALVTDAGARDYRAFEDEVVLPYLRRAPDASFRSREVLRAVKGTRIGEAALALCPQDYARF